MAVSSVLLTFKEHPIARMMLQRLITSGLKPACVIQEESAFGAKKVALYQPLIEGDDHLSSIAQSCQDNDITLLTVANINQPTVIDTLSNIGPELILLGNTRIIKPEVFTLARMGCVNIHPGLLPEIKGAFPQVWSILNDQAIGCTAHLIDEDVDTGPIIFRQAVDVAVEDDLNAIMYKTMLLSAELMHRVVDTFDKQSYLDLISPDPGGAYYGIPEPDVVEQAKKRLKEGAYSHCVSNITAG